jgi:hypothetical protein
MTSGRVWMSLVEYVALLFSGFSSFPLSPVCGVCSSVELSCVLWFLRAVLGCCGSVVASCLSFSLSCEVFCGDVVVCCWCNILFTRVYSIL